MTIATAGGAAVDSGQGFLSGSSGTWAGQRFLEHMQRTGRIEPAALRTLDTLRKDEWKSFDEALVEEGVIRLRGVADLVGAGLVSTIANGLGKTVREWEKVTDMFPAEVSMDGNVRTEQDRQEFQLLQLPLPITHKDFFLNLRTMMASRERGESLDTTQIRTAGRLIAEQTENLLFNGSSKSFGGLSIFGYTTHPDRNSAGYGATDWDDPTTTGNEMLTDLLTMIAGLETDRFFGPYWLYVSSGASVNLEDDFKANSDKTIRQRLLEVDQLSRIQVADQLAAATVVLVQGTRDVAEMIQGEPLQTVQWDINGGFTINFKAFTINVPLVKSDVTGRSGVFHMS